jgi:MFS family permease
MLITLPAGGLPVAQLLSAFTLIGAGLGTASVASTQTGTDAANPAYRGVLNSAAQVGTATGVALLVPLAAATASSVMTGYRFGFLGACAIALGGAICSLLLPARVQRIEPADARHN